MPLAGGLNGFALYWPAQKSAGETTAAIRNVRRPVNAWRKQAEPAGGCRSEYAQPVSLELHDAGYILKKRSCGMESINPARASFS